jgi:hypothetical protein
MGPDGAGLSCPGSSEVAETHADDAGFENPRAPETIGHDLEQLHRSQSLVEQSEESRQKSCSVTASHTIGMTNEVRGGQLHCSLKGIGFNTKDIRFHEETICPR